MFGKLLWVLSPQQYPSWQTACPSKCGLLSLPQKVPEDLVPVVLLAAVDPAEEEQGADDVGAPDVHP